MQPEELNTTRQLLRNIECTELYRYITLQSQKKELGFYQPCIAEPQRKQQYTQMLGIDCQMIMTDVGQQIIRTVIVREDKKVLYDKWYDINDGTYATDFLTHITGITEQILKKNTVPGNSYCEKDQKQIEQIIKGKIVVGHDLANDLRVLKITHRAFIDTVSLFPHNLGLPFKNKLSELTSTHLQRYIQWHHHDPTEDALAAIDLVRFQVKGGRGTIQVEPFTEKIYTSNQEILKDAELDPSKILLFVLRGSQALGMTVETADYKSDYDYVVVYDTASIINARLLKLPNIDISFFDKKSFSVYLQKNDISYIELFFLPKQYVFLNKFPQPKLYLQPLRESLGFHLNKSSMKYKRTMKIVVQQPSYAWKVLKIVHMKMRFMDIFLQVSELIDKKCEQLNLEHNNQEYSRFDIFVNNVNIDILRLRPLWIRIKEQFQKTGDFNKTLNGLQKKQRQMKTQVNSKYPKIKNLRFKGQQNIGKKYKSIEKNVKYREKYNKIQEQQQKMQQNQLNNSKNPLHELQSIQILRKSGPEAIQQYRVTYKRHRRYKNLIEFHYLQSASFSSIPPRQCRGLIVDEDKNYSVVALPYYKFFDYNDPKYSQLSEFDFESAKVYEKKDGSTAFLYFYENKWHVASSTIPDGENSYCFGREQTTTQFKTQFWKIFHQLKFQEPSIEDRNKTFIFEIMSKNHIIVVKRFQSDLCLHGVRNIDTYEEEDHCMYEEKYNWNIAKSLKIEYKNIDDLVEIVNKLDPLQTEGYVLCDKNWIRLKIKNSGYVRINWLGELNLGFNKDPKRYILIEIVLSGEGQTFIKYCPQWQQIITDYLKKIQRLNTQIINIYKQTKDLERSEFAQEARKFDNNIQALLFAVRNNEKLYYGKVEHVLNPKKFYNFISNFQ